MQLFLLVGKLYKLIFPNLLIKLTFFIRLKLRNKQKKQTKFECGF